jgi:hypothetical protein
MSLVPARVPQSALYDLTALLVPVEIQPGTLIKLIITVEDENLSVRGLSSYLSLADRVYGRLTEAGLRSYAQTVGDQLEIAQIRKGSLELVIAEILSNFKDATPLAILWLFLKYLPSTIKALSEAAKNSADAYKSIEEARLTRANRQRLRDEVSQDEILQKLDASRQKQIVVLLEALQVKESRYLATPVRFAREHVKSVTIEVKQTETEKENSSE